MNEQFELPIVDESSNNLVNLDVSFDCNQKTSFLITKSDNRCPSSPNGTTTLDQYDISVNHDINIRTQQTTSNQDTANDTDSESDSILTKKNQRILDKHKEILSKLKQTRRKVTLKPYEPMYNRHGQQTYCVCRKPDDGDIMIQCDTCKEWYHGACIDIAGDEGPGIDVYICAGCEVLITQLEQSKLDDINGLISNQNKNDLEPIIKRRKSNTIELMKEDKRIIEKENESIHSIESNVLNKEKKHPKERLIGLNDKTRIMAKRNFTDTMTIIFNESLASLKLTNRTSAFMGYVVDLTEPKQFALDLEEELFKEFAQPDANDLLECGQKYKSKYRSIQFNLKDQTNPQLRTRLLTGTLTIQQLVSFSPEELASESAQQLADEARKHGMQQSIKIKAEDLELKKANADVLLPNRDLTQWNSVDETIIEKPKWQIGHGLQIAINQMEVSNRLSSMNSASRTPARSSSNSNLENPFSQFSKSPKRNSESQNDDSSGQKKSRVETEIDLPVPFETELIPNTIASPLNPNTPVYTTLSNIFDGSTTSTPRLSVDTSAYDYSTYLTEGADYIPSPHSPPVSPVRICNSEKVWQGFLSMPLVASLQCSCHQVSGKEITSLNIWSQIITSDIVVDGRIGQKEVDSYLNQISSHNSTSKHIIVVEFRSQHNDREQYTKIFNYFNDKDRYGVIKSPFPTVKDFYIIPVKQNTSLPRVLVDLVECKVNRPVENTLYGVIILHSQVLRRLNIETLDPRYSVMSQNPQQENGNGVLDGAQPSLSILLSNLTSGLQNKQTIANPALEALLKQVSNQNKI